MRICYPENIISRTNRNLDLCVKLLEIEKRSCQHLPKWRKIGLILENYSFIPSCVSIVNSLKKTFGKQVIVIPIRILLDTSPNGQ